MIQVHAHASARPNAIIDHSVPTRSYTIPRAGSRDAGGQDAGGPTRHGIRAQTFAIPAWCPTSAFLGAPLAAAATSRERQQHRWARKQRREAIGCVMSKHATPCSQTVPSTSPYSLSRLGARCPPSSRSIPRQSFCSAHAASEKRARQFGLRAGHSRHGWPVRRMQARLKLAAGVCSGAAPAVCAAP